VKWDYQEVRLFALFNFSKSVKNQLHRFDVMIHTKGNKNKMFFELIPESIEFGDGSFNVYSNVI
jgi:hypothetical protein